MFSCIFKKELIDDYGFKITQAGIKMNEMIAAFKDLIPKKKCKIVAKPKIAIKIYINDTKYCI